MMKFLYNVKRALKAKNVVSVFIAILLVFAPISTSFTPQEAEAAWPTFDSSNVVQNTITAVEAVAQTILSESLVFKEYVLDFGAWGLVNMALEAMLQSTINWVNSGFDGKPLYITDLRGFLIDVSDYIVEDYLLEHLEFLCAPYMADIKLALEFNYVNYKRDYEVQCRLSEAVTNLEGFISGDFINSGGWDTWYEVALTPSNNIYGSLIEANTSLTARIFNVQEAYSDTLNRSGNFLDIKKCDDEGKNCKTITPGNAINEQLNASLEIPGDRLTIADELDELLGALFTQLVNSALNRDSGGVYGLTNSSGGNGSYFNNYQGQLEPGTRMQHNQVIDADQARNTGENVSNQAGSNTNTQSNLSPLEEEYAELLREAVGVIQLCSGVGINPRIRQQLDGELAFIRDEGQSLINGTSNVSDAQVSVYRNSRLPDIAETVSSAGCS
jgi:hypothetical protein